MITPAAAGAAGAEATILVKFTRQAGDSAPEGLVAERVG